MTATLIATAARVPNLIAGDPGVTSADATIPAETAIVRSARTANRTAATAVMVFARPLMNSEKTAKTAQLAAMATAVAPSKIPILAQRIARGLHKTA